MKKQKTKTIPKEKKQPQQKKKEVAQSVATPKIKRCAIWEAADKDEEEVKYREDDEDIPESTLEVFSGSMGSGKTSELLRNARRLANAGYRILCVGHISDTQRHAEENRMASALKTHDGAEWPAMLVERLEELYETEAYQVAEYILVDEGQFFKDLVKFIETARKRHAKNIMVAALDADSSMVPFVDLRYLETRATTFVKIPGICRFCGRLAGHSIALVPKFTQTLVGGFDKYASCCFACAKSPQRRELSTRMHGAPAPLSIIETDNNIRRLSVVDMKKSVYDENETEIIRRRRRRHPTTFSRYLIFCILWILTAAFVTFAILCASQVF